MSEIIAAFTPLLDYRLVIISGRDATDFLNRQLTQDIRKLSNNKAFFSGYCKGNGRLIATLLIWPRTLPYDKDHEETICCLLRTDTISQFCSYLSMFILRSKVKISTFKSYISGVSISNKEIKKLEHIVGTNLPKSQWEYIENENGTWIAISSADCEQRRWLWISNKEQLNPFLSNWILNHTYSDLETWHSADLEIGLPWIGLASQQNLFIPQTVNLDLIDAVSFSKGCYPGQEVVARSYYYNKIKRRMAYGEITELTSDSSYNIYSLIGKDIYDTKNISQPCGRIIDIIFSKKIYLLFETTLDILSNGEIRFLKGDGPVIHLLPLPYIRF